MQSLLLFGSLLRACPAVSLRSGRADSALERTEADHGSCLTASAGDWCHAAVTWASEGGAAEHPDWFPGDASDYSPQDFQSLLHQLGEAKCSRPCAQGTGPAGRRTLGLVQGQSFTRKVDVNETYGLSQEELEGVMESSWAPKDQAPPQTTTRAGAACQDLQPGSVCYNSVMWLRTKGFKQHPTWYPQFNEQNTVKEVQELLHSLGRGDCPKPCQGREAYQQVKLADEDKVLEVGVDGRQVVSEAYKIPESASCRATVEGEWCHTAIMWLKKSGLAKHPRWYPRLHQTSSIADFQAALHREHKMTCPRPCDASENMTTPIPVEEEVDDSTTGYPERAHLMACQDAPEESHCYKAISKIMDFNLWRHPEQYPGLRAHPSRAQVQEHLFRRGDYQCGWPCPKDDEEVTEVRRVKKRISDMTAHELSSYMDKSWDGYVNADEYDEYDPAHSFEKLPQEPQHVANERAPESEEEGPAHRHLAIVKSSTRSRTELGGLEEKCRDTRVGELCYEAATWAQEVGVHDHPSWYPGLSPASTLKDFQEFIHSTKRGLCEMPCGKSEESRRVVKPPVAEDAADTGVDGIEQSKDVYEERWESEREGRHRPPAIVSTAPAAEAPEAAEEVDNVTEEVNSTAEEKAPEVVNSTAEEPAKNSTAEELAAEEAFRPSEEADVGMDEEDPLPTVGMDMKEEGAAAQEVTATEAPPSAAAEVTAAEANVPAEEAPPSEAAPAQASSTAEEETPQLDAPTVQADSSTERPADDFYAEPNATESQALRDEHAQLMDEHAKLQEEHTRLKEVLEAKRLKEEHEALKEEMRKLKEEHAKLQEERARLANPEAQLESAAAEAEAGTSEDLLPEVDMDGQDAIGSAEAEAGTSEDLLPEVDMEGQDVDPADPSNQTLIVTEEVNSTVKELAAADSPNQTLAATEEVKSTAEEPVTQPTDADKWIAGQNHKE